MPAKVLDPQGEQNLLNCGYLLRDDALDSDGDPKRIPFINDHHLSKDALVVFDVLDATVNFNGRKAKISMAVIPDEYYKKEWSPEFQQRWKASWDPALNPKRQMKLGELNDKWKEHPCFKDQAFAGYQEKLALKKQR